MASRDPRHDAVYAFLAAREDQLTRLSAQMRSAPDLHELAWLLADFAGRVLILDDCIVYFAEPSGGSLRQYAAYGAKRKAERIFENPIRLALGEGVVGCAASLGAPQIVLDTRLDPRYVVDDASRLSELAVPIEHQGRVYGAIDSEHSEPDFFRSQHVHALKLIADAAAPAAARLLG
jgi:putative methionine-R-sulfoxide reductase with GAF domain